MELITGVVDKTEKPVLFSVPDGDFRFCFMTDAIQDFDNIHKSVNIAHEDGFIYGKTHNNHCIAIYAGENDFDVYGIRMLTAGAYIVSTGNVDPDDISKFNAISFSGGTLNRIFNINGIEIDYSLENGQIGRLTDDSKSFDITVNGRKINIDIRSQISFHEGQDGKTIKNSGVTLTLTFDKEMLLKEIFTHYYNILRVLSFMTFRKNVGFNSISLHKKDKDNYSQIAKVYIYNETPFETKDYQRNISIEDLGTAFPALISLFYASDAASKEPVIGFIPENDKDVYYMTGEKLKAICSSLENELMYIDDMQIEENRYIEDLKVQAKAFVKNYMDEHKDFPEGARSLVYNSIAYWSLSLREKLCALCEKYSEEIEALKPTEQKMDSEAIKQFVKFRNAITHSNARSMPAQVAETAFVLSGVVYCCVLHRLGVDKDKIIELAKYKLLK